MNTKYFNLPFKKSFYLLLIIVLFCTGASAQEVNSANSDQPSTYATSTEMELVLWFMGTKQSKSSAGFDQGEVKSHKKEIIKSGVMPNRILTRTFMNKVINYENTLV